MSQTNTLYIVIDPSGAQRGANASVNAINSIVQSATQLNVTINQINSNTGNMSRNVVNHFGSMGNAVNNLRGTINTLVGAFAAIQVTHIFSSFIDEIRKVDREYNGFIAMMTVTTGDINKSADAYQKVKGIANAYGVSIETLSKSYAKLAASTKDVLTEKQTDHLFESFTATASVLHAEQYTVERMFNAIIQMASKGQVNMEELKQQLGEHLPGTLAIAAKAMGMSMGTMIDEMKKGNISAKQLLVPLPGTLMEMFGEASVVASKSLNSSFARIKNTWFDVMKDLSTSGTGQGLSAILMAMNDHLSVSSESFKAFGAVVGEAFFKVADFIKSLSPDDIKKFAEGIVSVTEGFIAFVGMIYDGVKAMIEYKAEIILIGGLLVTYQGLLLASAAATGIATAAATLIATRIATLGGVLSVVGAAVAGWQIGTYFKEKFLEVELAGIALAAGLTLLPGKIEYAFENMALRIPRFFVKLFQDIANKANSFMASLKNSFSDKLKVFGFEGFDKFEPIKLDFLAESTAELGALTSKYKKESGNIKAIYDEMANEAISRRNKGPSAPDRAGFSKQDFEDADARVKKFMADAEAEFAKHDKGGKKGGKGGSAPKFADTGSRSTSEIMGEYALLAENLKTFREDDVIGTNQYYEIQLAALENYTAKAREALEKLAKLATDPKDKARINGQITKLDQDFNKQSVKLLREQQKENEKFDGQVLAAQVDMGTAKLSAQEEFIAKWNKNYAGLVTQANLNGQDDVASKLVLGYKSKIEQLNREDKITMDKFFATDDQKYLIDLAESYQKMHDFVMRSTAFTEDERAALIARLREQHNQKIAEKENQIYMDIAKSAASSMQKGFSDFFFNPFDKGLKGMLQSFGQTIQRMVADAAAAKLTNLLVGDMGKTGNAGGLLDLAIKGVGAYMKTFDGGGYTGNGARSGGLDGKGGFLSIVHPKETIVDHTKGQQAPGNTYIAHVAVPAGTPAESRRAAAEGARTAMTAMNGASRYA